MTSEKKQEYTRRISQANATGLTVILLEMTASYIEDAIEAWNAVDTDTFAYRQAIARADDCLVYLQQTLDFRYEVSGDLFSLYQYVIKQLMHADIRRDQDALKKAQRVMERLVMDFTMISEQDNTEPLMEYAEELYAGLTYGSDGISNNMVSGIGSRGFLA